MVEQARGQSGGVTRAAGAAARCAGQRGFTFVELAIDYEVATGHEVFKGIGEGKNIEVDKISLGICFNCFIFCAR